MNTLSGAVPEINQKAVDRYNKYFSTIFSNNVFEVKTIEHQVYYSLSRKKIDEWIDGIAEREKVRVTQHLDNLIPFPLNSNYIGRVSDITKEVQEQYSGQHRVISESYSLVRDILNYPENPLVQKAVRIVLESRENDESNRRYWRILNEQYYGLDIHPLMEFEVNELQNLKHYCENPEEMPVSNYHPLLLALVPASILIGTIVSNFK